MDLIFLSWKAKAWYEIDFQITICDLRDADLTFRIMKSICREAEEVFFKL